MNCSKCGESIPRGEAHEHNGKNFCEDCYIDVMAAPKFCDPWASYSAESFARHNPECPLTGDQKAILQALEETGGATPDLLMEKLKGRMSADDGAHACATLKRMGRISIENQDGAAFIRLK